MPTLVLSFPSTHFMKKKVKIRTEYCLSEDRWALAPGGVWRGGGLQGSSDTARFERNKHIIFKNPTSIHDIIVWYMFYEWTGQELVDVTIGSLISGKRRGKRLRACDDVSGSNCRPSFGNSVFSNRVGVWFLQLQTLSKVNKIRSISGSGR